MKAKKLAYLNILLLLLWGISFPPLSYADESVWIQTNGPEGGVINAIEIDPIRPDILYAGGDGGNIFKSIDGGESWQMLAYIALPGEAIWDILVSPVNPQTIYAIAGPFHKSIDGGLTWHTPYPELWFFCIAMDHNNPMNLIAGTWEGEVYYSSNAGESWIDITGNLPDGRIADVAIASNNEFWAGIANDFNGRLYHTINGGEFWVEMDIGQQPNTDIHTIFVDPQDTDKVYVGLVNVFNEMADSENDIYLLKTTDAGLTWTPLHLPGTDAMINVIGRTPTDDTFYVGSGGSVYKTNNDGRTWTLIGPPGQNGDMCDIAVDPRDSDVLYLPRRAHGIVKSIDGGINWTPINHGLFNISISLLAVPNVPDSEIVYATSQGGEGTFKTNDGGNSWSYLNEGGITHPWADELVVSPHDPETIWYVADVAQVFETTNGGTTWRKIIEPRGGGEGFRFGSVYALAPAPSEPDTIYALKNGFGIFKSIDKGRSWRFLHQSEIDYTYSIAVDPVNPDIVYSGYNPKPFQDFAMVRRTLDGGDSWVTVLQVPQSKGITSVVIDPANPDIIYAGSTGEKGRLYKSADGGDSWSILNEHFIMCTVWGQPQLIVHPDNPSIVYAATWLGGTWKTENAGETWTLLKEAPISATALSLNAQNPDVIYLADRTTPTVWKSLDAGLSWSKVADFSSDRALLVMRVLANGDTIYASTFEPALRGGKMYKSEDAGSTWTDITGILPKGILDITVNPADPNILYVTTNINGAYKSADGGASWVRLADFPDVGAYDIEVDINNPAILYASARGGSMPAWFTNIAGDRPDGIVFNDSAGVYKSIDSGSTWTNILTTTASCRVIRQHPDDPNMLFAADLADGLLVSIDGGDNWIQCNKELGTAVPTSCAVGGEKIYIGTQGCGVYSGDIDMNTGSITWQPERSNKPVPQVYSLQIQVDAVNSNRIYVSSYPGGLYRSDDGGLTFRDKNGITPSVVVDDPVRQGYYSFAINPSNTEEVWLGTWGKGIYKSYDAMNLDIPANGTDMKMYGKHIYQVLVYPGPRLTIVYVATEEGVFYSHDGGTKWSDISAGLGTSQVRTLAMTADGTLLCGTLGYELYSYRKADKRWDQLTAFDNFGTLWPVWDNRPLYQYTSLLFDFSEHDVIYFGTFPAGIYKSDDGGGSWRESNVGWTNDGVFSLVLHPEDANIIYAGTYNGVSRSTDSAAHWELWDKGWPPEQWVFSIDFNINDPNVMYACSKNGQNEGVGREGFHGTVMKSVDGGACWYAITNGLDVNQEFYKIIVDPFNSETLYLATERDGIFITYNGGEIWLPWNDGLTTLRAGTNGNNVTNAMVMSADGHFLYFGTSGSGVFRRPLF